MLNFLTTFGTETQFEKNRILLTKANYEAPNEQALKNILHTFAGQDQQTRSQIAYACIIKKINNSPAKQNWLYLLKNLIILDRVTSDNRFCQEVAQATLISIKDYVDCDAKTQAIGAKGLLVGFWSLIQEICRLKTSKKNILHYKRGGRKDYLETLKTPQIIKQIKVLQTLFENCLSLIFLTSGISNNRQKDKRQTQIFSQKSKKYYNQFTNSTLAEYLSIHFYSKLLTFFSCQYLCIHKFIQIILHTTKTEEHLKVSVEEAKLFKKMIYKFKSNCEEMKLLVERNRQKKGFQNIDANEFSTFSQAHIIKAIDEYINQHSTLQKYESHSALPLMQQSHIIDHNFVDRKPLIFQRFSLATQKTPRRYIQYKKDPQEQKLFSDYFNSYSDQFPHKNMMTIDLIEDIRRDQEKAYQEILESARIFNQKIENNLTSQQLEEQQNFLEKFKKQKQNTKFREILIFVKDVQKQDEKEDSTSYSNLNSSRGGSLFDVLNIKWQTQKSQA